MPSGRNQPGDFYLSKKEILAQWAVNTTFTGTGLISVRTPAKGRSIIVRAWHLAIVVDTQLAASTGITILFYDGTTASPGPGLAYFPAKAQMGDGRLAYQDQFDGFVSAANDTVLKLGASATIGAGVIRVSGVVYGEESPR